MKPENRQETRALERETSFATANEILLAPYALDSKRLQTVFGEILAHRVDYADLYFQYTRSESWSLEEGIVKSGSFNIDQGVGVRAVSGEKTAFAYSDDISLAALESAARATRAIARQGQAGRAQGREARGGPQPLHAARPDREPAGPGQGGAARAHRAPRPRARPARDAGDGVPRRANTKSCWSRARTASSPPTCARWCASRCR